MTVERRYALTKIEAGDYMLVGNDGQTLWRVRSYMDGPSLGLDDWPRDRVVWQVHRWPRPFDEIGEGEDLAGYEHWEYEAGVLATRAEAIDYALEQGERT